MSKKSQIFFSSDWHMNHSNTWIDKDGNTHHRGIIDFERHQFSTIQEHDDYIRDLVIEWSTKWAYGSTLYYLGDFGDIDYLFLFDYLRDCGIKVYFMMGNHDKEDDIPEIEAHVDKLYKYPIYLSKKLVISHEPVAVWKDTINISGHLHNMILDSPNYFNANIHICGYEPLSLKQVLNSFKNIPKYTRRFLYEPWVDVVPQKITQKKEDVIADKDGIIDVSASRLLQYMNTQKRIENNDPYKPYCGQ